MDTNAFNPNMPKGDYYARIVEVSSGITKSVANPKNFKFFVKYHLDNDPGNPYFEYFFGQLSTVLLLHTLMNEVIGKRCKISLEYQEVGVCVFAHVRVFPETIGKLPKELG